VTQAKQVRRVQAKSGFKLGHDRSLSVLQGGVAQIGIGRSNQPESGALTFDKSLALRNKTRRVVGKTDLPRP